MLTIIGLFTIVGVVVLLLIGLTSPIVALILVPLVGAVAAGFGPVEISEFFTAGLGRVMSVATMFIFAIVFFGVMQDAGLFRPVINGLIRATRGNVVFVAVGTAVVGMLAHVDGAGATTFLLTIPALLPVYQRLNMNPYLMLLLVATGGGVFNMFPWAGPVGRAGAVTGIEVTELWQPLIPVQIAGALLLVGMAFMLGVRERRRLASAGPAAGAMEGQPRFDVGENLTPQGEALLRPHLFWVNAGLFFLVVASLITGLLPAAYVFMIGLSVALLINYRSVDEQMDRIVAHAGNALTMGAIILAAGSFLGIMDGTGMLSSIAEDLVAILPTAIVPHLHILLGVFGLPMELFLSTDAYYFGLLPIVQQVVADYNVPPASVVYALTIGNIVGTFISPFSPALWLALGLAGLDMGRHIRFALIPMWIFSLVLFGFAWLIGLF